MSSATNDELTTRAILALFSELQNKKYSHWCPTPETQELTMLKRLKEAQAQGESALIARSAHDIWAWSVPVSSETASKLYSPTVLGLLKDAGLLVPTVDGLLSPTIRVSNLYPKKQGPNLYAHSSWPTSEVDSVFFGPDSYRYTRYLKTLTKRIPNCRIAIDMCTGAGVGAIHLALEFPEAKVYGLDINPKALRLARVNATHLCPDKKAGQLQMLYSDAYATVKNELIGTVDVIAIDPPFIADDKRAYAQGGYLGIQFTLDMLAKSHEMLRLGGEVWLHMAAPVTLDGRDVFREEIDKLLGWEVADYEIIDVDIFGNEMGNPNTYPGIGSIASVGVALKKIVA